MLLGQNRGRHQKNHLFSILYGLEGCPDRNLRLSVAHIPTDQPVHDLRTLHILLRSLDGCQLVIRLFIGKGFLEFPLPDRILAVDKTILCLAHRIELHQILGDGFYRRTNPGLGFVPVLGSQFVELRLLRVGPGVLLNRVELSCQHIEKAFSRVLDLHVILGDLIHHDFLDTPVNTETVIFVNHIISH